MRFLATFLVPFLLLFVGAIAKKLARGAKGFKRSDFFLGSELTLTALSSGIVQLLDLALKTLENPNAPAKADDMMRSVLFVGLVFCVLLLVISFHRDYELPDGNPGQVFWLLIVANAIGIGSMACFLLFIKV